MNKKLFSHLISVALIILAASFTPLALFFGNIGSVKFYEVAIFMGIFSVIALIVYAVLFLIMKSAPKAAIVASVFLIAFTNLGRLSAFMSYKFILVIFAALVGAVFFIVWKPLKEDIAKTFVPVMAFVLAALCVFNTLTSIPKMISVANSDSQIQEDISNQYDYINKHKGNLNTDSPLPNIYFLIVDEYAGFNSINTLYNYDNIEFKTFLQEKGFEVSDSSTNYVDGTLECLANVFNLEYSEKNKYSETSEAFCSKKVENACLFTLAEDMGYSVCTAQSIKLVDYESETEMYGDKWSSTGDNKTTIDIMVTPTMMLPFIDEIRAILNGVSLDYYKGHTHIEKQAQSFVAPLTYFSDDSIYGKTNTFTLSYAMIPHQPFFFDEDGNINTDASSLNNWEDKDCYLKQYKYCTKLLTAAVNNIIENDPESIIVLMSDHGVRNHSEENPAFEWMESINVKDITDILCAVYYKGESFDSLDGLCGANAMISVTNKAFGYNIPLIEQSDDMYYKAP